MLIGLVGAPSAGKSTSFKAMTLADVDIGAYPFTTIKPNSGVAYVRVKDPAQDFDKVSHPREGFVAGSYRFVPVQLLDVAGLVPGASEGKGMGNQFLDDLRQADVLIHIIDVSGSTNAHGESVPRGTHDPADTVRFLEEEMDAWYRGILAKGWEKFARGVQQQKGQIAAALAKQLSGLGVTEDLVKDALLSLKLDGEKALQWSPDELSLLASFFRKKTKPLVVGCNKIDIPGAADNFARLKELFPDHLFIACSAESELALREADRHKMISYIPGAGSFDVLGTLNEKQEKALSFIRAEVLDDYGSTGIQDLLDAAVFSVLKYKAIFPGGVSKLEDSEGRCLPDCFLMPPATTALDFAFKLHTDFGKKFIRAVNVKTKMPVGKDHVLEHGNIIEIVAGR